MENVSLVLERLKESYLFFIVTQNRKRRKTFLFSEEAFVFRTKKGGR